MSKERASKGGRAAICCNPVGWVGVSINTLSANVLGTDEQQHQRRTRNDMRRRRHLHCDSIQLVSATETEIWPCDTQLGRGSQCGSSSGGMVRGAVVRHVVDSGAACESAHLATKRGLGATMRPRRAADGVMGSWILVAGIAYGRQATWVGDVGGRCGHGMPCFSAEQHAEAA